MLAPARGSASSGRRALAAVERNARAQTRLIDDLSTSHARQRQAAPRRAHVQLATCCSRPSRRSTRRSTPRHHSKLTRSAGTACRRRPGSAAADRLELCRTRSSSRPRAARSAPARAPRLQVEIAVRDTGRRDHRGLPPYVFERFRQADAGSRRRLRRPRTGLAIVRHLVELHGGTGDAPSQGRKRARRSVSACPSGAARLDGWPGRDPDGALSGPRALPLSTASASWSWTMRPTPESSSRRSSKAAGGDVPPPRPRRARSGSSRERGASEVLLSDIEMPGEDGDQLLRSGARGQPSDPASSRWR